MVIIGIGCNIGDRLLNLRQALSSLRKIDGVKVISVSPVYESDALLPENAPSDWNKPFLNVAVKCDITLKPEELLKHLKKIESDMGRVSVLRWSPRVVDLDILALDDDVYQSEKLNIPHIELCNRPFALFPLADLAPEWKCYLPNKDESCLPYGDIAKKWGSRFSGEAPFHTRQIAHRIDTPEIVGVLNVSPDSFSDGGKYYNVEAACHHAESLFLEGADIIDIGAESTRPRATRITEEEEWKRLESVLSALSSLWKDAKFRPKISVDTRNAGTFYKSLSYGIDWLNNVDGFGDDKMCKIALESDVKLVFMHNLGIPPSADNILPTDKSPSQTVIEWALSRLEKLVEIGIKRDRLIFDVGIGFGKSPWQNFELIKEIEQFKSLNLPILVGHSRKSFMTQFTSHPAHERDIETSVISEFLALKNVDYIRVHNVDLNMRALKVSMALF